MGCILTPSLTRELVLNMMAALAAGDPDAEVAG